MADEFSNLAVYHNKMITALNSLSWVASAQDFPCTTSASFSRIVTPAVWLSLTGWTPGNSSDGECNINLAGELWVITTPQMTAEENAGMTDEQAAAALTRWLMTPRFAWPAIAPPVFIAAKHDNTDARLADYRVWRITFNQQCRLGADAELPSHLKAVWLAQAPDIGCQHLSDYQQIYQGKTDE